MGMVMAFDLSVRLGLCPADDAGRVRGHLEKIGLPTTLAGIGGHDWDIPALLDHMRQDKKVQDGQVTFVLTRGIGQAFLSSEVRLEAVQDLLRNAVAA